MPDPVMNPRRFTLVYRNEDGTAQSLRLWTHEEATRRLTALNQADTAEGTWTIYELTELEPA